MKLSFPYLDNLKLVDTEYLVRWICYVMKKMDLCKRVNGFVTEKEPWVVAKDPARQSELEDILYNTAESLRALAVLLHPVMPEVTEKLWKSLGAQAVLGNIGNQIISEVSNWGQLPTGSVVTKTEVLFPRLEEAK